MNISYNWLKKYINLDITPEKVAEILTSIGLEVGSIDEIQTIKGGLNGLVIGKVLTREKHPNADKLSKTTVDIGTGEVLSIVCGAPNVDAGQTVVVATVGTTLYSGNESFVIKKSKIRGELSEGMICAEDEIGLGKSHDGIMVLPNDIPAGTLAKNYFNIENDVVLEVDLTPNRIDSASHYGVARDLAAFLNQQGKNVTALKPSVDDFKVDNTDFLVSVSVENSIACPRYSGLTISGIEVKDSPDWLQKKLRAIGMSPINNVVDVTNFVLHEIGQPLHAFDGNQITGNEIIVKTLESKTKFITLDEKERELDNQDLMICNGKEGMCIAGVFGGLHSGVSPSTKKIFLESACFNPVFIRKTAKRHILSTDASFRFERGTDPNITVYALKRAALLIKEVAGGNISSDIIDVYPEPIKDFVINIRYKNIDRLIGKKIEKEQVKKILSGLEIKVKNETEDQITVHVPPYRVDVTREVDVIEEILRIYGYNNIEMPEEVHSTLVYSKKPDNQKLKRIISEQLIGAGFQEIMCNSLTKAAYFDGHNKINASETVILSNPLSNDLNALRQTLLFGGLESIIHNINRRNTNLKFFEFGNCYFFKDADKKNHTEGYQEIQKLGLFITGDQTDANWITSTNKTSFYHLKTHAENILIRLGIELSSLNEESSINDIFNDCIAYVDNNNNEYLTIGRISDKTLKNFDINQPLFYCEINWDTVIKKSAKTKNIYTEIPKYPEVRRDLALLIDKQISFKQIKDIAYKTEKKLLKNVSLFDVFEGEKLGNDKKSYAVSFTLLDETKTLNDKQIDKIMQKLVSSFKEEIGAQLR
ncbi:MAG: phenylalanine--tRNA ligase subunit beta [Marinilabiliaceae bacterium]|nr:phenylalanine--tRNA ligase subunit beta [Marinilabiliaceae bacterium]